MKRRPKDPVRRDLMERQEEVTWDAQELVQDFEVVGRVEPFVAVCNRRSGRRGTMQYRDDPRVYFNFKPVEEGDTK